MIILHLFLISFMPSLFQSNDCSISNLLLIFSIRVLGKYLFFFCQNGHSIEPSYLNICPFYVCTENNYITVIERTTDITVLQNVLAWKRLLEVNLANPSSRAGSPRAACFWLQKQPFSLMLHGFSLIKNILSSEWA